MDTQKATDRPRTNWYLSGIIRDTEGLRLLPVPRFPCLVGRSAGAEVALPCQSVSKGHAEFCLGTDGRPGLRDLNSTNGTFVNGQRLEPGFAVPLCDGDLIQFATLVFRLTCGDVSPECQTLDEQACDRALALMQFSRLLNEGGMMPCYQPVIDMHSRTAVACEVLGRSRLFGLTTPAQMFSAAARLNLEVELSQAIRDQGVLLAGPLARDINLFVNTHPGELVRDGLVESLTAMRKRAPEVSLTLKIHEAAITNLSSIRKLRQLLADLDIQLAFDHFGAGRARLVELSEVRPDFVKFDMNLTRDIHRASDKRQEVVALIARMIHDLGITSVAKGVECEEAHEVLQAMHFRLAQGFHYGRPRPIEAWLDEGGPRRVNQQETERTVALQISPGEYDRLYDPEPMD